MGDVLLHLLHAAQHFGAEDVVCGIALAVFHVAAVCRGEEEHVVHAKQLGEVVVEISGFLVVVEDKKAGLRQSAGQRSEHCRNG